MKVMIYVRPRTGNFFRQVVEKAFIDPTIVTYSDFKGLADLWAGKYIYDEKYDVYNADFEKEAPDIILRCRLLRDLPYEFAHMLAGRYWNGIEKLFDSERFDYLIVTPVDVYSLDIICRVADRKGVSIISCSSSAFANYSRITLRGEYSKVREDVPDEEVEALVGKMTKTTYLSPSEVKNVKQTHISIFKYYCRRILIEKFYHPLMRLWDRDPWNYSYETNYVRNTPLRVYYNKDFDANFRTIKDISFDPKRTVYYPMHLIPEATTDYWCKDIVGKDYNETIINMITSADPGITFIIKEHPAMYGKRLLSFYRRLNSMQNVILLHPMDRSNELLLQVENVVVDNGTVGIEALMRGKRVIVLEENYYYKFHPNAFRTDRVTQEVLDRPLLPYSNEDFMRKLLQGCFVSDFKNSRLETPKSDVTQLADGIIQYMQTKDLPR